jgi:hypothetical protein
MVLLFSLPTFSQIIFEKHFSSGQGWTVKEIPDGYIMCGSDVSSMLLIKTDIQGNLIWEKRFGDLSGLHPEHDGFDLLIMPDDGFIVAGRGLPYNLNSFAYFVRTDASGNQLWDLKVYSDIDSTHDDYYTYKIAMTSQGDIVAAGRYDDRSFNKDYTIIKIDTSGNLKERKHINTGINEYLTDFIYTDTAYYFLGYLSNNGHSVINITKTDSSCNIITNEVFGSNMDIEIGNSFLLDSFENIYVAGIANYLTGQNYFLNTYTLYGDTLSLHKYAVSPAWQVIIANDLSYNNGKFFIAGYESGNSPNEGLLLCLDTNGTENFRYHIGGNDHDMFYGIFINSNSKIICIGETSSFGTGREVYLAEIDPDILLSVPVEEQMPFKIIINENVLDINLKEKYLNQKFNLTIYDLLGKRVVGKQNFINCSSLDISSLKTGLYILKLENEIAIISREFIYNQY